MQQVEADKRGEPEPVGAVVMREQQAGQDERAGKPADDEVHFHTSIPSRQRRKSYKPIADISILWGVHPIRFFASQDIISSRIIVNIEMKAKTPKPDANALK